MHFFSALCSFSVLLQSALCSCRGKSYNKLHVYFVTNQHFKNLYYIEVNEILGDISYGDQFSEDDNENIPSTTSSNKTIIYDPVQHVKSTLEE